MLIHLEDNFFLEKESNNLKSILSPPLISLSGFVTEVNF